MRQNKYSDRILLEHIRECIGLVQEFTSKGQSSFNESMLIQGAVIRYLQVLSESTQRLSDAIKKTEPDIPWRGIRDFRNILTHGYLQIDTEIVWSVVEKDLPALADAIVRMISVSDTADLTSDNTQNTYKP